MDPIVQNPLSKYDPMIRDNPNFKEGFNDNEPEMVR